jgi:serine/threonine-protein kinase RsbW
MVHVTDDQTTTALPGLRIERPASPGDLMTVVHAVPAAVPAARKLVRRWLDTLTWPIEDAEDIELAVNEAISNVVDHAYPPDVPGPATLHAWVSTDLRTRQRRVVVAVTDRGGWAAHHPDSPAPHARGHGLAVMSGCMAELHIQRSVAGTTVIMISAATRS